MCKCIKVDYRAYRVKVQFFSPDRLPTARGEFTQYAGTIPEAILRQKQMLNAAGYNQSEFVIHYIEVEK